MPVSNKPMKFSTFHLFHGFEGMTPSEVYRFNIEIMELAEELGFDGVWGSEHHFRRYGMVPSLPQILAYVAARTEKLRLGTGVMVLPLHNPIHVAEEMAQLDVLSGGRVNFGVGRGYQSIEFDGHGVALSEARDRFNEALDLILSLWSEGSTKFDGEFYSCGDVELVPHPTQAPHPPVWVAAVSPETVEMYAKRGLPILADPAAPIRKLEQAASTWHANAAAAGHDTSAVELVASRSVWVASSTEQAIADQVQFGAAFDRKDIFNERSAPIDTKTNQVAKGFEFWEGRYLKGGSVDDQFRWEQIEIIGDPERAIGQIKALQDFGFSNLMCDFYSTRPMGIDRLRDQMRFFAKEIMPAFR